MPNENDRNPHEPNSPGDDPRRDPQPSGPPPPVVEFCDPATDITQGTILPDPALIVIFSRGTAILSWRDLIGPQRKPINRPSVWFVPAGIAHGASWLEPARILRVRFHSGHLPPGIPERHGPTLVRLVDLERTNWHLAHLSRRLQAIDGKQAPASDDFFAEALEFGLLVLGSLLGPDALYRCEGLAVERFEVVSDFIELNLTRKFSRGLLARAEGKSLTHFARMFKQRIGLTPRQYIDRRRCHRAREMIEQGQKLVDVAPMVGFFDQSEMCKKFNNVFGCPPSTFSPPDPP